MKTYYEKSLFQFATEGVAEKSAKSKFVITNLFVESLKQLTDSATTSDIQEQALKFGVSPTTYKRYLTAWKNVKAKVDTVGTVEPKEVAVVEKPKTSKKSNKSDIVQISLPLNEKVAMLSNENNELKAEIQRLLGIQKEQESEIISLRETNDDLRTSICESNEHAHTTTLLNNDLKDSIVQLQSENATLVKENTDHLNSIESQVDALQEQIKESSVRVLEYEKTLRQIHFMATGIASQKTFAFLKDGKTHISEMAKVAGSTLDAFKDR